jgi:hypothetical protein
VTFTAPAELATRPQWVAWRIEDRIDAKGEVKPTKVPYNARTGKRAASTDPSTWAAFEVAVAFAEHERMGGIGFVVTNDDPYVGVDLDHCRDDDTGAIEEWAAVIAMQLDSYTEISPSGTGLRIFVRGELPPFGKRKGHVEMYQHARFLTVTGNHLEGSPEAIEDRCSELLELHHSVFGAPPEARQNGHVAARLPLALADADVLKKARGATNGEKFWALWNGDWSGSYDSQSEADLALVSYLAFYTGPDEARLDQLFRASGLVRDKWDRPDYRGSTISKALDGRTEFYGNGSLALAPRLSVNGLVHASAGEVDPETGEVVKPRLIISLAEMVKGAPESDRQLVEGMLWAGLLHWLYSGPGSGKTMLALAMGMHIAAGKPFLGRAVEQGTVLLVEEDSPRTVMRDYVELLAAIYDIDLDGLPFYMNDIRGLKMSDEDGCNAVKELVAACPQQPLLLILDACERLVPSADFNSRELAPLKDFRVWAEEQAVAMLMIDHTRKPGNGDKIDDIDLLYGGRSKSALADIMMCIKGSIKAEAKLTFPKRRGEDIPAIDLNFDAAGGFIFKQEAAPLSDNERLIIKAINNAPGTRLTKADIMKDSGLPEGIANRALQALVKAGRIDRQGASVATTYGLRTGTGGFFS